MPSVLPSRGIADKYVGTVPVEHLTSTWTYMMSFAYGERTIQAALPLYSFPDEALSPSVQLLVNLFGQVCVADADSFRGVMHIFLFW